MIEEYIEAKERLIKEAIRINSLLSDINHEYETQPWCGTSWEYLDLHVDYNYVRLEDSGLGVELSLWYEIPRKYFSMCDEDIAVEHKKYLDAKVKDQRAKDIRNLERMAKDMGYTIFIKE